MKEENVFRHEYKHEINSADEIEIRNRLKCVAKQDEHADVNGGYDIHSLYFDNVYDKALVEKMNGLAYREKFRIRFYNDDTQFIRLEKKEKVRDLCRKTSAPMTREECEQLLKGNDQFLLEKEDMLCKEFYAKMHYQMLRPKSIVEYHREVFLYEAGHVRITIDTNIASKKDVRDFFEGKKPSIPATASSILEVKYDDYLPKIICDMVQIKNRHASAFSKYAACRLY